MASLIDNLYLLDLILLLSVDVLSLILCSDRNLF